MFYCQRTLQFPSPTRITEGGKGGIFAEVEEGEYAGPDSNVDTIFCKVCQCGSLKIKLHQVPVYKRLFLILENKQKLIEGEKGHTRTY